MRIEQLSKCFEPLRKNGPRLCTNITELCTLFISHYCPFQRSSLKFALLFVLMSASVVFLHRVTEAIK